MNRRVFEALKREEDIWHEDKMENQTWFICTCGFKTVIASHFYGEHVHKLNPNFSTWEGFGWAWERIDKREFIRWLCFQCKLSVKIVWILWESYTPKERCEALDQFLTDLKGEK